jgi:hypothetical protein
MKRNSKYNEASRAASVATLKTFLEVIVTDGGKLVEVTRGLITAYGDAGFSVDDDDVRDLLGIKSETDDIDTLDPNACGELKTVWSIYRRPFEEARNHLKSRLAAVR